MSMIACTPQRQIAAQQRPSRYLHGIVQGLLALMLAIPGFAADTYPLDGLSAAELETAVEVLRQSGRVDDTSRFSIIRLAEPDKATVLRWNDGDSSPRRAFAVIRHEERVTSKACSRQCFRKSGCWLTKSCVQMKPGSMQSRAAVSTT
jgi:Cu2+-containing amine oxidase